MKKNIIIILATFLIVALVIIVFVSSTNKTNETIEITKTTTATTIVSSLSLDDIAKHSVVSDCWLIINKKVYDVSKYLELNLHPAGSEAIIPFCGKDATVAFETRNKPTPEPHSDNARNVLNDYYVGDVKN